MSGRMSISSLIGRRLEGRLPPQGGEQTVGGGAPFIVRQRATPGEHGAAQRALVIKQGHAGRRSKVGRLHDGPWFVKPPRPA